LAKNYADYLTFLEVDVDLSENRQIVSYESIKSMPTIIFYNNSLRLDNYLIIGSNPEQLEENIKSLVASIISANEYLEKLSSKNTNILEEQSKILD
jgi:thioredoxin-like negative regulator of GroEL